MTVGVTSFEKSFVPLDTLMSIGGDEREPLTALEQARLKVASVYAREMRREPVDTKYRAEVLKQHQEETIKQGIATLQHELDGLDEAQINAKVYEYMFAEDVLVRQRVDEKVEGDVMYRVYRKLGELLVGGNKVARIAKKVAVSALSGAIGGLFGGVYGAAVGIGVGRGMQVMSEHRFESLVDKGSAVEMDEGIELEGDTPVARLESLFAKVYNTGARRMEADTTDERGKYRAMLGRSVRSGAIAGGLSLLTGAVIRSDILVSAHADTIGTTAPDIVQASHAPVNIDMSSVAGSHVAPDVDTTASFVKPSFDWFHSPSHVSPEMSMDAVPTHTPVDVAVPEASATYTHPHVELSGSDAIANHTSASVALPTDGYTNPDIDALTSHVRPEVDVSDTNGQYVGPDVDLPVDTGHISPGIDTSSGGPEYVSVDVELPSFEFGYSTATEHLLQDVASEQLGVKLDGREAYLLINHLMEETGGKVFEGVDTVFHGPGDVWIMNPGGETSGLTADALKVAQEWLDMGRPGLPKAGV